MGIFSLNDALAMARQRNVDLVEVAANATPPVCRLVDFGKYRYEQAKKEKESKKHQHANKVKEIQLSANIDPHDFSVKLSHAIEFLCEEMKVKVTLRFRGREMAHQEFGFGQVKNFIRDLTPYGHPDAPPKLIGKGINVMLSPLPRNKRAKNPNAPTGILDEERRKEEREQQEQEKMEEEQNGHAVMDAAEKPSDLGQNPFTELNAKTQ